MPTTGGLTDSEACVTKRATRESRQLFLRQTYETPRPGQSGDQPNHLGVSHMWSISRLPSVCSGLVDLGVCVRHHGGGGHGFALAGERFGGLVAEHIAEGGDHVDDFGKGRRDERTRCETGDGGSWFIASEPVEQGGEDGQRATDHGGVASVVEIAYRHTEVIEGGERVAV